METRSSVPEAVVIGEDEGNELHVQPVAQSGRRHVDIWVWRRTAPELSPSRVGLTLQASDLDALQAGIAELLASSSGGKRAGRVVWDGQDSRRLRAEIEPFGTRFLARLGFWQRVRDTWKPIDDGVTFPADGLQPLQDVLDRLRPWLLPPEEEALREAINPTTSQILDRWPAPGADWLTLEPERIAFHPKGVRITCTVTEEDVQHWLVMRQWRRQESLWVPEPVSLALSITDLDWLLSRLLDIEESDEEGRVQSYEEVGSNGSTLRVGIVREEGRAMLCVDQRPVARPESPEGFEPRLWLPAEYLPRLGRALAQGWFLLAGWLSDVERSELQRHEEELRSAATAELIDEREEATLEDASVEDESSEDEVSSSSDVEPSADYLLAIPATPSVQPATLHTFAFGAESDTPGAVMVGVEGIHISVEGRSASRSITLPAEVLPKVLAGLENLNALRQRQPRVDPVLLCDRRGCAVYGRVGTGPDPNVAEITVWSNPTTSESIDFDAMYLPDLIDALRRALRLSGGIASMVELPGPPRSLPQPGFPARMRVMAPAAPLLRPGPIAPSGTEPLLAHRVARPIRDLDLGRHRVSFSLEGRSENPMLTLLWPEGSLEVSAGSLDDLLTGLRELYYEALRGRRGKTLAIGTYPVVLVSIHSQGPELDCILQQEIDGEITQLDFPASAVPAFLDVARSALTFPH